MPMAGGGKRKSSKTGPSTRKRGLSPTEWQSRRARRIRIGLVLGVVAVILLARMDWRGGFRASGDDMTRYHERWFEVAHVIDG
ncbi:MAG: hypothetical protein JJU36_14735, partial [Phycisphaeraceae bacterium]|nr:hypothetical protein [Phycisphaeraceae bacterium]